MEEVRERGEGKTLRHFAPHLPKLHRRRALELLKEREGVVISGYKEPPHAKLCDRKVGLSYEEKLGAMTGKKVRRAPRAGHPPRNAEQSPSKLERGGTYSNAASLFRRSWSGTMRLRRRARRRLRRGATRLSTN